MATTKAFWDVDGVLNANTGTYRVPDEGFAGWRGWRLIAVEQQPITYSEELIERINKLAQNSSMTPFWLTSWADRAPSILAPAIGLEAAHWQVLGYEQMVSWARKGGTGTWWKLQVVKDQMRQQRGCRTLWIDDEIAKVGPAQTWSRRRSVNTTLTIAPREKMGITKRQLQSVERFLKTK